MKHETLWRDETDSPMAPVKIKNQEAATEGPATIILNTVSILLPVNRASNLIERIQVYLSTITFCKGLRQ
jgi:hypothetical protein